MSKKLLLLFLFPLFIFGQLNSKFTYSMQVIENKESKMMELMETLSPNFKSEVKNIEFTLVSDTSFLSCFSINKETIPDDEGVKLFLTMSEYAGKFNQINDSLFIEKDQDYLGTRFTVKDTINKNWKVTNESKEIMGYKCFKATCDKIVVNTAGIFKNQIIAWFCPQLPYQFGPMGYGKLPGLIFELQTKYALYGLKSMNLKIETPICKPNEKSVLVTSKEFENFVLKSIENKRALMKN